MNTMFVCRSPLASPANKRMGLTRIWVETGQLRQPLACVWVATNACSESEPNSLNAEPSGLCLCA
jgi:hypothetical protein